MAKKRIPSEFELNRKMQRTFDLQEGDMYCDDFSNEKLPRSSYPRRILNERNLIPLGYDSQEGFVRYKKVGEDILVDPLSGNICYKQIDGKWIDQRTEKVIQIGPGKKKLINGIISGLEKSANSDN